MEKNINLYINNIKRMFIARKYKDIKHYIDEKYSRHTVEAMNLNKKIMARIVLGNKLHIGAVKECIHIFSSLDIHKALIIHEGLPTSSGKNLVSTLDKADNIKISLFDLSFFSFCILDHRYYFPHIKIKKDELIEFKKFYENSKIPIILTNDPVAQFFDYKSGDVLKILRKEVISYRIVKN